MARWFIVRVEPNADAIRFNQHGTIFGGTLADFDVICFKGFDFHLCVVVCILHSIINFPGKLKMMGNLLFGTNNKMFSLILVIVNVYLLYLLVLEKHNEQNMVPLLQKPNALLLNYDVDNKKNACYCEEPIIQNHQLQVYQPKPNYSVRIVTLMGFGLCFQIIYSIVTMKYCHEKYKNKDTFIDHYMRKNL